MNKEDPTEETPFSDSSEETLYFNQDDLDLLVVLIERYGTDTVKSTISICEEFIAEMDAYMETHNEKE